MQKHVSRNPTTRVSLLAYSHRMAWDALTIACMLPAVLFFGLLYMFSARGR